GVAPARDHEAVWTLTSTAAGVRPRNPKGGAAARRPAWSTAAGARHDPHERHHPRRGLVSVDGESRPLQARDDRVGGKPQLAVDALAETPAVLVSDPDEVVNLHRA